MKHLLAIPALLLGSLPLSAQGVISPLTGVNGEAGHLDGTGGAAVFNDPMGLARDADGNLFVCDARNHVIRKISASGEVTTLAGEPGIEGAIDGVGSAARFRFPADVAISPDGVIYVADSGNHCIRKIQPDGTVSTLAGDLGDADDIESNYGTASAYGVPVTRDLDGTGAAARFNGPSGIVYAPNGLLYVSDTGNQIVRSIDANGVVVTVAGKPGEWGSQDGTGNATRFYSPMGMCVGTDGNLYIADSGNHTIRCMTPQAAVTTFSGNPAEHGCKGGSRLDARFCSPADITPHPDGGFIICESFGNSLFRMKSDGMVTMFAGGGGSQPQPNTLSNPSAAVCDDMGNVYVSDTFNQEIRLIIEDFEMAISKIDGSNQLTITWDSLPGRSYQLQELGDQGWQSAPVDAVAATSERSSISFPLPANPKGIYRILLLGFSD